MTLTTVTPHWWGGGKGGAGLWAEMKSRRRGGKGGEGEGGRGGEERGEGGW
jgi:hypothetical protein